MEIYEAKIIAFEDNVIDTSEQKKRYIIVSHPKGLKPLRLQIAQLTIVNANLKLNSKIFLHKLSKSWKVNYDKICEYYNLPRYKSQYYKKLK